MMIPTAVLTGIGAFVLVGLAVLGIIFLIILLIGAISS